MPIGLKLELCRLTNRLLRLRLLQNPRIICVEFEFFLGPLKTPELRTVVNPHPPDCCKELVFPYFRLPHAARRIQIELIGGGLLQIRREAILRKILRTLRDMARGR